MILVVNLNPSLDKIYTIDKLEYGGVVRTEQVQNTAGGKGTHVANVINILGDDCTVAGFLGGHIGNFIADILQEKNINNASTRIANETRSCLNIAAADGTQTEILEPGSFITEAEQESFMETYKKLLHKADIVVASGSLPKNIAVNFYERLIDMAKQAGKIFLLDTSGQALVEGIKAKPYFIKPNKDEIEMLTGRKIASVADAVHELQALVDIGITMPCISLGKEGSLLYCSGKIYHAVPPVLKAVNAVGSGDAYVSGIAVGLHRKMPVTELMKLASACGTANVLEKESGFVRIDEVNKLEKLVTVAEIV